MTERKQEPLVENVLAAEIFASEAVSFAVISKTNIVITFASSRWNSETNEFQRVVLGRLVMPVPGAQDLALGLNDFLSKRGFDPSVALTEGLSPQ